MAAPAAIACIVQISLQRQLTPFGHLACVPGAFLAMIVIGLVALFVCAGTFGGPDKCADTLLIPALLTVAILMLIMFALALGCGLLAMLV